MKTTRRTSLSGLALWLLVAALVVAIGCGGCGGGGGGGGTGGGNQPPVAGQYLEFRGVNRPGNLDPVNLRVGDVVQLEIANYDPTGTRTVLSGSGWATTAGAAQVTVTSSGRLTVRSRPSGFFRVSGRATVLGSVRTFAKDTFVPASSSTTISGFVRADFSQVGVKYCQVEFYDASGRRVGGATSGDGGAFSGRAPSGVVAVSINGNTVDTTRYYKSVKYRGTYYTTDGTACPIPVSGIGTGRDNPLPSPLLLPRQIDGPPPPPEGCR
jgi:hypothetical protein